MDKGMNAREENVVHSPAIQWVREGMRVVDSEGEALGEVKRVKVGDPEAVTTGQGRIGSEREPDVPEPRRSLLIRHGYLKVSGPGIAGPDLYVRSDHISNVSGDTVMLSVSQDEMTAED